jgi:DNA helicase HerA-like ATPase
VTGAPDVAHLRERVKRVRGLRAELEDALEPTALSVDGRTFTVEAPLRGERLPIGGYVHIEAGEQTLLGQVLERRLAERAGPELAVAVGRDELGLGPTSQSDMRVAQRLTVRFVAAEGLILGRLEGDTFVRVDAEAPFADAPVALATEEEAGRYIAAAERGLAFGPAVYGPADVPVRLHAQALNRHTFLCGQSGSGKTYSLGVLLEQLLLETRLRIVLLDPNSDYVTLPKLRDGAESDPRSARFREVAQRVRVLRPASVGDGEVLQLRAADLEPEAQAALAGLDPLADRSEYAAFREAVDALRAGAASFDALRQHLPAELQLRLDNLGILTWEVWRGERGGPVLDDVLDEEDWQCLVLDLGALASPAEQRVVAERLLERLWRDRLGRRPTLIVIDEAHNVCPAEPEDGLQAMITDRCVQIAGEGRKYGLYLLASTQRPAKLHPNVLSQCENIVLMRMNSGADLAHLQEVFSMVPAGLLAEASAFELGESLLAGRIVAHPTLARSGRRLSREGGGDVPPTWAQRLDA